MKRPIIGITLDWENTTSYAKYSPWYAIRQNYADAVVNAGGVPLFLPYDNSSIEIYANLINGLIVPGGDYDIDPEYYNKGSSSNIRILKQHRVEFEASLIKKFIEKSKPVLGICAGMQLINVIFGGSLFDDILAQNKRTLNHEQSTPHNQVSHNIEIKENTLLHKIAGKTSAEVNSTHHQAVDQVADNFIISAIASDGIIEAIEHKDYSFVLGVEWHPEYEITELDRKIFKALIKASL